jgi:NADPH-dependent 2,4-dienoyl-CoA reductase/sulfur reductase-like enzyme
MIVEQIVNFPGAGNFECRAGIASGKGVDVIGGVSIECDCVVLIVTVVPNLVIRLEVLMIAKMLASGVPTLVRCTYLV